MRPSVAPKLWRTVGGCNISWSSLLLMGVAGLIHGPDTGHLSEYGGRDDEDVAPREHEAAILKKNLREIEVLVKAEQDFYREKWQKRIEREKCHLTSL